MALYEDTFEPIVIKPGWQTPSFCPYSEESLVYKKVVKLCEIFNLECLCTYRDMCLVCQHILCSNNNEFPMKIKTYEDWKLKTIFSVVLYEFTLHLEYM